MPILEELGFVTIRSGVLLVIDTGYLGIWSHDRAPSLRDGSLNSAQAIENANSFVDLKIEGADAEHAGRFLGMSPHPLYVFDQPADHHELQAKLKALSQQHKLDASFRVISPRIAHRKRAALALERGGAGEIQFHGVPAVAIGGIPTNCRIAVLGERMAAPDHFQWRTVFLQWRKETSITRSDKIGNVGVDYARLLVADIDAVGMWKHEESLDGLADFVFWGRDAADVAKRIRAPEPAEGNFDWTDLREKDAIKRGAEVRRYVEQKNLRVADDYRPHSHHWQVMKGARDSSTESGMAEIGGMTVCNFMTTWGDGLFEVYRDMNEAGDLVQVRIEFSAAD
jgi:hypothetical protein